MSRCLNYVLESSPSLTSLSASSPGLASNLYASGGPSPDLLAHADKAVDAWVNGPGEVEAYDPNNPQASHFTQVGLNANRLRVSTECLGLRTSIAGRLEECERGKDCGIFHSWRVTLMIFPTDWLCNGSVRPGYLRAPILAVYGRVVACSGYERSVDALCFRS